MKQKRLSFKIGCGIIIFMTLVMILSVFWTPYDPEEMNILNKFAEPNLKHLMGTDKFGRDILSRVMDGLTTTFVVAMATVGIGVFFGTIIGSITGYFGGVLDEILMRINDAMLTFPSVLLALVVVSIIGVGKYNVIIALGILFIPSFARGVRGEFINYKNREFVKSARLMGASHIRIMFVHILPNAIPTILTLMTIGFNNAVLAESSMSYLGLGVQPPDASLGSMLSEAQGYLTSAPWYALFPTLIVIVLIMGFALISNESQVVITNRKKLQVKIADKIESDALLTVSELEVAFEENVINKIEFTLHKGDILGIVGESGSGKTMTALSVMGLLPLDALVSGGVFYNNTNLLALSRKERQTYMGKDIAMIFQEPMTSLNPLIKVGKQIDEMLKLHTNYNKSERKQKVIQALEEVELEEPEEVYYKYPYQLSGGMRQRVMIAMAMICEPDILIADEPTTALDADVESQIIAILGKLNNTKKTTIIFISHNLKVVKKICDKVLVMHNGTIVERGIVDNIFDSPKDSYTKELIDSIATNKKKTIEIKTENILELKDVQVYYYEKHKKKYVLKDMNFTVKKGEIVGFVGKSGSGKTSLSKAILGIHKGYDGKIMLSASNPQMVFQDPYSSLNPKKTIGWILEEPLRIHKIEDRSSYKQRAIQMLEEVELSEQFYYRYPNELSGGQRQRVSIAIALMLNPEFIIADEPVSALDVTVGSKILELLLRLQKERGLAILFISHDKNVIERVSDRIVKI